MLLNDLVEQFRQQSVTRVGVGVLVEYPLSRPRHKVHGTLLGKLGKKHTAPYNVRKASVVILAEGQQHRTTTVFTAVSICWKRWWRVRFAKSSIDGYELSHQDEKIQICELQNNGQYTGGRISDFYVLDLSGTTFDIFDLMACANALRNNLSHRGFVVEDLGFLASCDDVEWLARRYPSYVPKPLKQQVKLFQIEQARQDISSLSSVPNSSRSDFLEAKDRLRPGLRWWKRFLGLQIVHEIVPFIFFAALIVLSFWLGALDSLPGSFDTDIAVGGLVIDFVLLIFEIFLNFKTLSRLSNKFLTRYRHIEESRDRQTEAHY